MYSGSTESIPFAAPVEAWKKKKGHGPAALLAVVLLGMAYLAGTSYHSNTNQAKMMTHSDEVNGMVTNLQGYPHVIVRNKTPYDTMPGYTLFVRYGGGGFCKNDVVSNESDGWLPWNLHAGETWTASSRGACLVTQIYSFQGGYWKDKVLLQNDDGSIRHCKKYVSTGTSYSEFSIIMDGDRCCVKSSHELQNCD